MEVQNRTDTNMRFNAQVHNMLLKYDNETKTTRDQFGVSITVSFWDETKSVESVDAADTDKWKFFTPIIQSLVDRLDYQRDVSIRGAPYDFRKGPGLLLNKNLNIRTNFCIIPLS